MFTVYVKQHDGAWVAMRNVPDHITNAGHIRLVKRWVEDCRRAAFRAGYKVERN